MNVQQLIDVLQKVEDKSINVFYSYDSRAGEHSVHCVDIETYNSNGYVSLMLRDEATEEYEWSNYTLSFEQYTNETMNEPRPDFWRALYPTEQMWHQRQIEQVDSYRKNKHRFEQEYSIRNLYLEDRQ